MKGYIYGLVCPISNEIVYVGKSTVSLKSKLQQHKSSRNTSNTRYIYSWIRNIEKIGLLGDIKIVEISSCKSKLGLDIKERMYINTISDNVNCVNSLIPKIKEIKINL